VKYRPTPYREQTGAPAWTRVIAQIGLVGVLLFNLAIAILIWFSSSRGAPQGLLIASSLLSLVALALLIRLRKVPRPDAAPHGANNEPP
jgi:hypothetical protein